MKCKPVLALNVALLAAGLTLAACSQKPPTAAHPAQSTASKATATATPGNDGAVDESGVVAVVDGEDVHKVELERSLDQLVDSSSGAGHSGKHLLRKDMRSQALDNLINSKVQVIEARRRNIPVSQKEIDALYAKLEKVYASPAQFKQVITKKLHYTPQQFRAGLADDIRIEKLRKEWIAKHPAKVSDQEIEELYNHRKQQFVDKNGKPLKLSDVLSDGMTVKQKLRASMSEFKSNKEYEVWVSKLRADAQVTITTH